ncbi:MAG: ATP-dependent DNA helicase RecG [Gammaproteobacteria bacterium]|nr:ATP-dependent DNA helicase RecG [Gammaproteobacteria bacterium]
MSLTNDFAGIKGIGPKLLEKLSQMGINSGLDVLFRLPRNYQDRTRIYPLRDVQIGYEVQIEGEILSAQILEGKRRMLLCHITDGSGKALTARFFHFNQMQYQQMQKGLKIRCFGEIHAGKQNLEMVHPEYRIIHADAKLELATHLTPLYSLPEGLGQNRWRSLVDIIMARFEHSPLPEYLPDEIRQNASFPTLFEALKFVHHPPPDVSLQQLLACSHPMQKRLIFEELLAHRLSLRQLRQQQQHIIAPTLAQYQKLSQALLEQLPFALTNAQTRVIKDIRTDLAGPKPMLRLLEGDVGSGKTLVALMAILQAVESGYQAAIMAPTEILAEQHYLNFTRYLDTLKIPLAQLASKLPSAEKKGILEALYEGNIKVIVGTHALFQEGVAFHNLALVIIDEQHRFGVEQRLALQKKGQKQGMQPHQLIMTATPIPRTLAMTAYADLDLSIIDELPPGRTPIQTVLIPDSRRDDIIERVKAACESGRQAYWVCTLIEESETLSCQAAEQASENLKAELPNLHVGLIHGRMKAAEKTAIMSAFKAGTINVLVATTVIEVGVDVPNASLMIIENPERLGLSQLHQLRGRVGRGSTASFCVLLYHHPLSPTTQERLKVIRDYTDGFKIAEKDLELRGPGEVLGTRQTGDMSFRIASIVRDQQLLPQVQSASELILTQYADYIKPLLERWIGLAQVYGRV